METRVADGNFVPEYQVLNKVIGKVLWWVCIVREGVLVLIKDKTEAGI